MDAEINIEEVDNGFIVRAEWMETGAVEKSATKVYATPVELIEGIKRLLDK